jgi:hypothetical protein
MSRPVGTITYLYDDFNDTGLLSNHTSDSGATYSDINATYTASHGSIASGLLSTNGPSRIGAIANIDIPSAYSAEFSVIVDNQPGTTTFRWSPVDQSNVFEVRLAAGRVYFTVTNDNGNISSFDIPLEVGSHSIKYLVDSSNVIDRVYWDYILALEVPNSSFNDVQQYEFTLDTSGYPTAFQLGTIKVDNFEFLPDPGTQPSSWHPVATTTEQPNFGMGLPPPGTDGQLIRANPLPAGYSSSTFHTTVAQAVASDKWVIKHDMNCMPTVQVYVMYEGSLQRIIPNSVVATDLNTLTIGFTVPFVGTALLK